MQIGDVIDIEGGFGTKRKATITKMDGDIPIVSIHCPCCGEPSIRGGKPIGYTRVDGVVDLFTGWRILQSKAEGGLIDVLD